MLQYKPFAENFIACFACPILRLYLEQVERYVQGNEWMSRKAVCHTIIFFEERYLPSIFNPHDPPVSILHTYTSMNLFFR